MVPMYARNHLVARQILAATSRLSRLCTHTRTHTTIKKALYYV